MFSFFTGRLFPDKYLCIYLRMTTNLNMNNKQRMLCRKQMHIAFLYQAKAYL